MSNYRTTSIDEFKDGLKYWYLSENSYKFGLLDLSKDTGGFEEHSRTHSERWISKVFKSGFPERYNDYSLNTIKKLISKNRIKVLDNEEA